MTKLILFSLISALNFSNLTDAYAQTAPGPTLEQTMHGIGSSFKTISKLLKTGAPLTDDELAQGDQASNLMIELFATAVTLTPKKIESLPLEQQSAARLEYKSKISQELSLAVALQKSFVLQGGTNATEILGQMTAIMKDGHTAFRE